MASMLWMVLLGIQKALNQKIGMEESIEWILVSRVAKDSQFAFHTESFLLILVISWF